MIHYLAYTPLALVGKQTSPTAEKVADKGISVLELIFQGGFAGTLIIGVLLVLLFIALFIYFERLFSIRAASSSSDPRFVEDILASVSKGNINEAKSICREENTSIARLMERAVSYVGRDDFNKAVENAGRLEVYKLEKNVNILATISGAAPMIGFLGTVIGMILAFHNLSTTGGGADMASLAKGIYTAMTTTVAGLVVGIIAYMGYNHLVTKTDKVVHQMESTVVDFADILTRPA